MNLKRVIPVLLSLMLVLAFMVPALAVDGTYEGTAQGFGGEVKAVITIKDGKLLDLVITGDKETPALGTVAILELPPKMLTQQQVDLDAVAGATVTSNAIEEAVAMALEKAGMKPEDLIAVEVGAVEKTAETLNTDLVVIGAGGAGMTAAITAKQMGLSVILLEKMSYVGGNTTKATGGMNAAETSVQKALGIEDSVQTFIDDTMKGGKNVNDLALVTKMAEESAAAIDWLASIDAPLPEVSFSGGATNKRIHRPEGGASVGPYLVEKLEARLLADGVDLLKSTKATHILLENGQVAGVQAESETSILTINAKAVILATGGFGGNLEMVAKYKPTLSGYVTTNAPSATGDGIVMAEEAGAALVDMEQIQTHPTVHQKSSIMLTESVRGGGAILVNQSGLRFINEMGTRDVVSDAENQQEGSYAYMVFDQQQRENLSAIEKYVSNGLTVQADTLAELATLIKVDPATLEKTVEEWNLAVANKKDEAFGRDTGMEVNLSKAPFYAVQIAPGIHHTMGGVKIDPETRVLDANGNAIPGLFAAGEVTGGVHGANRIGGNAVADIIVFGMEAGEQAAAYIGK